MCDKTTTYQIKLHHKTHQSAAVDALIHDFPLSCLGCRGAPAYLWEPEGDREKENLMLEKEVKTIRNIRNGVISGRAGSGGRGLQRLLSVACLLISSPRGLAWPRKLISGACNTSHPLCWPEQRPTLAATCSPNTNTQAPLWPWPCPAAPTQCTHFGTVLY